MLLPRASQGHSASVHLVPAAADFPPVRSGGFAKDFHSRPPPKSTLLSSDLFRRQPRLTALLNGLAKSLRQPMHRSRGSVTTAMTSSSFRLCTVSVTSFRRLPAQGLQPCMRQLLGCNGPLRGPQRLEAIDMGVGPSTTKHPNYSETASVRELTSTMRPPVAVHTCPYLMTQDVPVSTSTRRT